MKIIVVLLSLINLSYCQTKCDKKLEAIAKFFDAQWCTGDEQCPSRFPSCLLLGGDVGFCGIRQDIGDNCYLDFMDMDIARKPW